MSETITRAMLCETATEKTGLLKADVYRVGDRLVELMATALMQGETVKLTGFGSLQVRPRAERVGRNPRTGTEHKISARSAVIFTPSARLRNAIDEKLGK